MLLCVGCAHVRKEQGNGSEFGLPSPNRPGHLPKGIQSSVFSIRLEQNKNECLPHLTIALLGALDESLDSLDSW